MATPRTKSAPLNAFPLRSPRGPSKEQGDSTDFVGERTHLAQVFRPSNKHLFVRSTPIINLNRPTKSAEGGGLATTQAKARSA